MLKTALAVVVVGVLSCRTPDVQAPRTHVPEGATATGPTAPGPANLSFTCSSPRPSCDAPSFTIAVRGDVVESCEVWSREGSVRLQLRSSNDPHDGILLAFDGFHGAGRYALDQPGARFVQVDDDVAITACNGPTVVGKRVSAADPNCGSPACTLRVDDATPDAGFPKPLTFTVHCPSVCANGSDATCQGSLDFMVRTPCG